MNVPRNSSPRGRSPNGTPNATGSPGTRGGSHETHTAEHRAIPRGRRSTLQSAPRELKKTSCAGTSGFAHLPLALAHTARQNLLARSFLPHRQREHLHISMDRANTGPLFSSSTNRNRGFRRFTALGRGRLFRFSPRNCGASGYDRRISAVCSSV